MRSFVCLCVVAPLICSATAQKGYDGSNTQPVEFLRIPTTTPVLVDESDITKECPDGFMFVGKQCAKTLTAMPEILCPSGTVLTGNRCAKYIGKTSECPAGYKDRNGTCIRENVAAAELRCPPEFHLKNDETCVKKVSLPNIEVCPSDAVAKGESCVKITYEVPDYVCPNAFSLVGNKCQREEIFDCTPLRPPEISADKRTNTETECDCGACDQISNGKENSIYRLPTKQPVVKEYVIQKTCKRITKERARVICPRNGRFNGETCEIDILTAPVTRPGGYKDITALAEKVCPENYLESGSNGECMATETVAPDLFCPIETEDIGEKCAVYTPTKTVCPNGYWVEGHVCTKIVFSFPLVKFTRTYTCIGKNCAQHA